MLNVVHHENENMKVRTNMKSNFSVSNQKALGAIEVMIIIATIVLIGFILLPMLASPTGSKRKSKRISCVNNLKQVGLSFRIYANDNNDLYPMAVSEADGGAKEAVERREMFRIFQVMSNELSIPKTAICPADDRMASTNFINFNNSNVSYFVGLDAVDTKPDMLLSGDRNITIDDKPLSGNVTLGTNVTVAWTKSIHEHAGNIGMADGSVQQVNRQGLYQQLRISGDDENRLVFPQ